MIINQESINSIFNDSSVKLTIFPYQRVYQWNLKLVKILYNDIKSLCTDKEKSHFLGTIHVKNHGYEFTELIKTIEIIDSQQRLLTLFIMLKALLDYEINREKENLECNRDDIENSIKNMLFNNGYIDVDSIKLKPKKKDNEVFSSLMLNEEIKDKESLIYINYKLLLSLFEKDKINTSEFLQALERVKIIKCITEKEEDSLIVFNRVNSDRQELNEFDFIRAKVLNGLNVKQQEYIEREYIYRLESVFDYNYDTIIEFLRAYLIVNQKVSVNKNNINVVFDEYFIANGFKSIEKELKNIIECALIYKGILDGIHDDVDIRKYLEEFRIMNIRPTRFLLLKLLYDFNCQKILKSDLQDGLAYLESYVIRRYMCDLKTNQLNGIFMGLINHIKAMDYFGSFKYYLLKSDFINNESLKKGFLETDIYKKSPNISKFILYKIESYIQNKPINMIKSLTVEHVMPQSIKNEETWKRDLGDNFESKHKMYVNKIGNLTITDSNSKLSNKSFRTKVKMNNGFEGSNIKLNREIAECQQWNDVEIDKRSMTLYERACDIWEYPDLIESNDFEKKVLTIYDNWPNANLIKVKIFDKVFEAPSNKTQVYRILVEEIYKKDREKFISLIESNLINAKDFAATNPEDLYNQYFTLDEEYPMLIGTKLNTQRKRSFIRRVVELLGYNDKDIQFIELSQSFKQSDFAENY